MRRVTSLPAPGHALIFADAAGPKSDRGRPAVRYRGRTGLTTNIATIDWGSIGASVAGAVVAGLGVVLAFAIGLRGLIRASELRAEGRGLAAGAWGALGAAGLLVAIAGTMGGLLIVASDGPLL